MASRVQLRRSFCVLLWGLALAQALSQQAVAQRFVDQGFQAYTVQDAPDQVELSLRRFLDDRLQAGESIEIISDGPGKRVLVRGSDEVQQIARQFVEATQGNIERPVRGYAVGSTENVERQVRILRDKFSDRRDVRIAGDERTGQILVQAPADIHSQISDLLTMPAEGQNPTDKPGLVRPIADRPIPQDQQVIPLRHLNWQDMVRGLRGIQGRNVVLGGPAEGNELQMTLASADGESTLLQIDQQNNRVRLNGSRDNIARWGQIIQAMDQPPSIPNEARRLGALVDAEPDSITRTIALLGGSRRAELDRIRTGTSPRNQLAERLVDANGNRLPLQVAQANDAAAGAESEDAEASQDDDSTGATPEAIASGANGSFRGPVNIQFLEGTDIFIVTGHAADVEKVMQIIQDIERQSKETSPAIEVYPLKHINSQALAQLITDLNAGPLVARQGDISVTALVKPNAVLLVGRQTGVDAVKKIIEQLDAPAVPSAQFRAIRLKYMPSVDAERSINVLFGQQSQTAAAPAGQTATNQGFTPRVRVVADFRSNAIIVYASPTDLEEVAKLMEEIDVPTSTTQSEIRVFKLKNALAEDLANVLNTTLRADDQQGLGGQGFGGNQTFSTVTQPRSSPRATMLNMIVLDDNQQKMLESGILSDVTVAADNRANSLVITAPKGSMDLIAELVKQLDQLPTQDALIKVFPVLNGDATSLIQMLEQLFQQTQQQQGGANGGPAIQTAAGSEEGSLVPLRFSLDQRTNSIVASGNKSDLQVVEAILLKLDSNDASTRRTEVYELLNARASQVALAVTNFLTSERDVLTQVLPQNLTPFEQIEREVVVVAEDVSNKLIISATDRYFDQVMKVIRDLDKRAPMVRIQVLIGQVTLNNTEEFGVELGLQDSLLFDRSVVTGAGTAAASTPGFNFNNFQLGNAASAAALATREELAGQTLSNFALGRTNSDLGFGGFVLSASNESINLLLRALQESRRLEVLSRPQVMMMNNREGRVQVGANVPYITNSNVLAGGTIQNTTAFLPVGLILRVIPRISPDGLVVMEIFVENSDLGPIAEGIPITSTPTGEVIRSPQINITSAQTTVSAQNGQTVILGGLITKTQSEFERKVPYLGDIPFFGRLFRADGISNQRTELIIIMTPQIIQGEGDIQVANDEELSRMSWCVADAIDIQGDIYSSNRYDKSSAGLVELGEAEITEDAAGTGEDGRIDMQSQLNDSAYPEESPTLAPTPEGTYQSTPGAADSRLSWPAEPQVISPPATGSAPGSSLPTSEIPQARSAPRRVLPQGIPSLSAPKNAAAKQTRKWGGERTKAHQPTEVSPAEFVHRGAFTEPPLARRAVYDGSTPKSQNSAAIYRFDEVPEE